MASFQDTIRKLHDQVKRALPGFFPDGVEAEAAHLRSIYHPELADESMPDAGKQFSVAEAEQIPISDALKVPLQEIRSSGFDSAGLGQYLEALLDSGSVVTEDLIRQRDQTLFQVGAERVRAVEHFCGVDVEALNRREAEALSGLDSDSVRGAIQYLGAEENSIRSQLIYRLQNDHFKDFFDKKDVSLDLRIEPQEAVPVMDPVERLPIFETKFDYQDNRIVVRIARSAVDILEDGGDPDNIRMFRSLAEHIGKNLHRWDG